jgi:hypothetical protein
MAERTAPGWESEAGGWMKVIEICGRRKNFPRCEGSLLFRIFCRHVVITPNSLRYSTADNDDIVAHHISGES